MADKVKKQNKKSGPADLYGDTTPKPSNVPQTAGETAQQGVQPQNQMEQMGKIVERLLVRERSTPRRTVGGDLTDPNALTGIDWLKANGPKQHSWEQPSHDGVSANLGLEQSRLADIFKSNNQQDIQGPNGQLTRQNQYGIGTNVAPPPVGHPEARGTDPRQGHGMLPSESSGLHDWLQQTFNTQAAEPVLPVAGQVATQEMPPSAPQLPPSPFGPDPRIARSRDLLNQQSQNWATVRGNAAPGSSVVPTPSASVLGPTPAQPTTLSAHRDVMRNSPLYQENFGELRDAAKQATWGDNPAFPVAAGRAGGIAGATILDFLGNHLWRSGNSTNPNTDAIIQWIMQNRGDKMPSNNSYQY